ncbi:MAG: tRNA (adenosine(37)-N6)-dimethylallyltransferase MiaA [Candidatus Pacebacteria bacterium]|nr:tRNA (adenosine(37)-N6)-dimethylallyltransferase MiaA [Candidatus Paceibacterota bacterium]
MKKYWIITFGCQMNKSDSERIAGVMQSMGFKEAFSIKEADFAIVNMCSVRQSAVDRVYGQINNLIGLKRAKKGLKTILTGCILGPDKAKMAEKFDFVLDKNDLANWPAIITNKCEKKKPQDYLEITPIYESRIQAFVPISNGCDNFCTYCAVPYTRGNLVSRKHKSILREIKALVEKGYKEIWLLGENVNGYLSPADKKIDFAALIKEIDKIDGEFWLRFTSPHPKYFSDKLIDVLAKSQKFAPYLNLPAQSGDNSILKKMNRPYTAENYIKLIKKIRLAFKKYRTGLEQIIGISTDIIVGFPAENRIQFNNTAKLMRAVSFDMAFIAQYSPRPQSFCYKNFADSVPKDEKRKREKDLTAILKATALKNNQLFLAKTIPVLTYEKQGGYYLARTRQNKPIRFKADKNGLIGQIAKVKVNKATAWSLEGSCDKAKLITIAGPTASGKTDLAIKLAKKFNGEIISADSRLVYKKMDIGTAKPLKDYKQKEYFVKGIRHHLIDILDLKEDFNAALFKERAIETINNMLERGKLPILVGGTGLYIKAIIDNLDFPKIKPDKKLRAELERKTTEELFRLYKKLDPSGAKKIDKNNKRRLIRAIEVCKITGQPFWQERKIEEPIYNCLRFGIKTSKTELESRIKTRVEKMIKLGLEKEAKKLFAEYGKNNKNLNTIGYSEWKDYFSGKIGKEKVKEDIVKNTVSYAKRQTTWFKKENHIKWISDYKQAEKEIQEFLKK